MSEAQRRVSSIEYAEMMAYYQLEPWGCEAEDTRAALICTVITNMLKGKKGSAAKLEQFMLRWGWPKQYADPMKTRGALLGSGLGKVTLPLGKR